MKNKPFKILLILSLIILPIFVGWLVSFGVFDWLETTNDWIGFWGGYLGGLCTLIGVLISINFSKTDSNEKQRMSVIPYISVERNASVGIDEKQIPIGLVCAFGESRSDNHLLFFEEVKVVGKCVSVGLGPAINCGIKDIKIADREIDTDTSKVSVLTVNGESYFMLWFYNIGLFPKQLKRGFVEYYEDFWSPTNKDSRTPEIDIEFYFYFEDVMGHKYKQKVRYTGQLSKPVANIPDGLNILFASVEKPELTK